MLPLLLLAAAELLLRVAGYGYSTDFFKPATIAGKDYFVQNDQFGLRFFPPALARVASPVLMNARKDPGTIRVFILGESAALGDPRPNYGPSRYLEVLLRARFPGTKFEVINTCVTAINSHVIREIARDCARHNGDVWVVYMGNNEMVGPFGAATVFGLRAPPLRLVRLILMLKATRLGQLLGNMMHRLQPRSSGLAEWHGMQMFLQNQVPPRDRRKEVVYHSFQQNLADILRSGLGSGASIVLSTVAVNQKDCPPFGSASVTNLPPSDGTAFEKLCQEASAAQQNGNPAEAANLYQQAADLCPQSANVQYLLGQCLLHLTNAVPAGQHLQLAVDADTLPFRADSRINDSIKAASRQLAGINLALGDAVAKLASAAPAGICGEETFLEHVHFNFAGNYRLGRLWAEQIQELLGPRLPPAAPAGWLSQAECDRLLGLTDWNRLSVLEEINHRIQEPPFQHQLDQGRRLASLSNQINECKARIASTPLAEAEHVYQAALAAAPTDYRLHENYAEFLEATHDKRAVAERQKVCEAIPHFYFPHFRLGLDLKDQGRLEEALPALRRAAALSPEPGEILLELGVVLARQGQWQSALRELERVRRLSPNDPRACLYTGEVLWKLKRPVDSIASLREAIRLRPQYWEAHYRLGEYLAQSGEVPAAIAEFEEVIRLNPGYVRAHSNLGVALYKLGRLMDAVDQFDAVLRLEPQNRQAWELKQQALNRLNFKGPG